MRAYVFTDKSLSSEAGRFVWLSIDTENSANSAFLKSFKIQALPSLLVIDPKDETAVLRWVGGATLPQLRKILDDASKSVRGKQMKALDQQLARADRLYAQGKNKEAAVAYKDVLAAAPKNWSAYGRTVESLLFALSSSDAAEECASTARAAFARLKKTPSSANVAATGLSCALDIDKGKAGKEALVSELAKFARSVIADKTTRIIADERSAVYQMLAAERREAGDDAGRKEITEAWAAFLEGEAAKGKSAEERAVFDSHRMTAYLDLEQYEKAAAMLEAAERDLPKDYNPPARLATVYRRMKRFDEALAASDRALKLAYGPRRLGIFRTRADIYVDMGNREAATQTIRDAIAYAESMPEGQRNENTIASLKRKLDEVSAPPKS